MENSDKNRPTFRESIEKDKKPDGKGLNVYVAYDEETALWCVFGTESGFAYSSWFSEDRADESAAVLAS